MPNLKCECGSEKFKTVWSIGDNGQKRWFTCAACLKETMVLDPPYNEPTLRVIVNAAGEFVRTEEVKG